jgi:hypothetical protein
LAFASAVLQGSAAMFQVPGALAVGLAASRHSPTDLRKPSEHQKPYCEQYWATPDEMHGWAQATLLLHSRFEAMSAPARNVASLAHTVSSVTHSQPTKAPKLQSTLLHARRTP